MRALCRDCRLSPMPGPIELVGPRILRDAELDDLAIAQLNCNAFHAIIGKRERLELCDVAVVVGGIYRSAVATCCYFARTCDVRSAIPVFFLSSAGCLGLHARDFQYIGSSLPIVISLSFNLQISTSDMNERFVDRRVE